ncbi:MAG TPA: aminoacyl-tRNA hydrolase [Ignavibacteriaceae bacterium]|nr:aminoacyl-tRNA hydrolase [Ignavibacteriaceae bacterium]
MKVIFGIGNPGNRYQFNRHNIGFLFADYLTNFFSLNFIPSKYDYYFAEGKFEKQNFSIIKPTTYVNNSGIAANQAIQNYNLDLNDFLLIYDDLNLEFPVLKIKVGGSDGGHNGLSSIIYHLNDDGFPRLRFGIGNDFEKGRMVEYVLSDFSGVEMKDLEIVFKDALTLIKEFIKGGNKSLLDANSTMLKNKINPNLQNPPKGNQENL